MGSDDAVGLGKASPYQDGPGFQGGMIDQPQVVTINVHTVIARNSHTNLELARQISVTVKWFFLDDIEDLFPGDEQLQVRMTERF